MSCRFLTVGIICILIAAGVHPADAGTTGSVRGTVLDSATNAPVAGVRVTVDAPSQLATVTADAAGEFRFISLAPDSYALRAEKEGYLPASQAGVVVFADQAITLQVKYPYGAFFNITEVGTSSVIQPFNFFVNVNVRL